MPRLPGSIRAAHGAYREHAAGARNRVLFAQAEFDPLDLLLAGRKALENLAAAAREQLALGVEELAGDHRIPDPDVVGVLKRDVGARKSTAAVPGLRNHREFVDRGLPGGCR